jgi:hypothetical protein
MNEEKPALPGPKPVEPGLRRRGNRQVKAVKLNKPIWVENNQTHDLEIPVDVNLGDLMATDEAKGRMGQTVHLIAKLADIPLASAKQIDWTDMLPGSELGDELLGFLSGLDPELLGDLKLPQ